MTINVCVYVTRRESEREHDGEERKNHMFLITKYSQFPNSQLYKVGNIVLYTKETEHFTVKSKKNKKITSQACALLHLIHIPQEYNLVYKRWQKCHSSTLLLAR